jgi:hypothetical protein
MATTTAPSAQARVSARTVRRAGAIVLAAAAFGLLVQLLFFDTGLGINFPLAVAFLLAVAWLVPGRRVRWPLAADAWLAPAALVLSVFVGLRGDRTLVALDLLGSVT